MAQPGNPSGGRELRADLSRMRSTVGPLHADRRRIGDEVAAINAELRAVEGRKSAASFERDRTTLELLERQHQELVSRRDAVFRRGRALDAQIRVELDQWKFRIDPCDADAVVPLLLLPVRIETRYLDQRTLRIRIFPDDIHVDGLERGMTDAEQAAALAYWTAAWAADAAGLDTAWRVLQEKVGKQRALWVAVGSEPTNLTRRGIDPAPKLPTLNKPSGGPAVARLLPDHFIAIALQGGQQSKAIGNAVGTDICVSALANDGSKPQQVGLSKVIEDAKWLVDYEEAVKIGLGVTLTLARPGAVDALFVFGVRRSLDPRDGPDALADLLRAHRCVDGAAFVAQGSPTNNTETSRAAFVARPDVKPPARDMPPAPGADSNAAVLGDALGIDTWRLAELEHGDLREQADALAMNVALWGPSWGQFLKTAQSEGKANDGITEGGIEYVRSLHRDYVRGRGPLPALRIGDQPYAVLPVSIDALWTTDRRDRAEAELLSRLRLLRSKWRAALPGIPRVGSNDPIDKTMEQLLGSAPVSFAAQVRRVLANSAGIFVAEATGASKEDLEIDQLIDTLIWEDINNGRMSRPPRILEKDPRPLPLPYVHESDIGFIENLLAKDPVYSQPQSVLQALLALAWDRSQREAAEEAGIVQIAAHSERFSDAQRAAVSALYGKSETAPAGEFLAQASSIATQLGVQARPYSDYHPVPALKQTFHAMAATATSTAARDEFIVQGVLGWLGARGRHNELRDALVQLTKVTDIDRRRILVAETLDTASHRLDAWITAIVDKRRRVNRARQPGTVTIGAYGWVHNLRPRDRDAAAGGYIHAPSIAHATTAGILRSAYLSHNPDGGGDGAFAIDLASARVRLALELLDGIRKNQPLAALLGYRIERALHKGQADRLILSLRSMAPLLPGKLTDRNEALGDSIEVLGATNVVDGIALIARYKADTGKFKSDLSAKPKNNPYLDPVTWVAVTANEWNVVVGAITDAQAALDAVADLLLAEGVHQLARGNVERAVAVMDAASGNAAPPQPEFIATPSLGIPIVHQLLLIANGGTAWNVTRPRAAAEPALEAWAGSILGDATTIAVASGPGGSRVAAKASGLCALDMVYAAESRLLFDARLRASLEGQIAPAAAFFEDPDPAWPAGTRSIRDVFHLAASLRALLTKARPLTPGDLALPGTVPAREAALAEVQAAHARVAAATGALSARGQSLQALVDAKVVDPAILRPALEQVAAFGIAVPVLEDAAETKEEREERWKRIAALVAAEAARRVIEANTDLASISVEAVTQAAQRLFGDGFWVLCGLTRGAAPDAFDAAFTAAPKGATQTAVRRFLTDRGSVRDGARRVLEAAMLAEATAVPIVAQARQMVGGNGSAPRQWIALPLEADEPTPTATVVDTVAIAVAPLPASATVKGLVVDQWSEVLPAREQWVDPDDTQQRKQIVSRHASAVAFNADAPGARPPQALLLGVSPDGQRWNSDRVLALLQETLELAQLRLVTLEKTIGIARVLPALYTHAWSLQGEPVLKFGAIDRFVADKNGLAAFLKDTP
jgi:hypothetical protein